MAHEKPATLSGVASSAWLGAGMARMTNEEINALKAEHDRLWREGNTALETMQARFKQVMELRKQIEEADKEDYDPIWLLFNGTFEDDGE